MKKFKKVKGFNMNKKTGHVSYAYWQKNKNVRSLGFTHNLNDKSEKEHLVHNIDPDDCSACFVKTKIEKQKSNDYRQKSKYKNFRIHDDDKPLIRRIISSDKTNVNKKRR